MVQIVKVGSELAVAGKGAASGQMEFQQCRL
jgi:hypothetical protein